MKVYRAVIRRKKNRRPPSWRSPVEFEDRNSALHVARFKARLLFGQYWRDNYIAYTEVLIK